MKKQKILAPAGVALLLSSSPALALDLSADVQVESQLHEESGDFIDYLRIGLPSAEANAGASSFPVSVNEESGGFFGNLRIGFISAEDDTGDNTDGAAYGGKLGYISPRWNGLSAGATLYATQELFDNENGDFFASDGSSYSILGEAFLQGNFGNTELKAGRFEFDSPYADTDDIRMVPNTFQGALLSNSDISNTTLYLVHLDEWAGVDADEPEEFNELNGDDGITLVGAAYEGIENLGLQAWYYWGDNFADLLHLEALYETDNYSIGAQFGSQSDNTSDDSGPDGHVFGITGSYTIDAFTLAAAYNKVSDTVINGFGGGPFFTSADDYTIEGVEDQKALALGLEYGGIEGLTLGVLNVDFDKGEDETDFYATYDVDGRLNFELIYHDMHDDGHTVRLMTNLAF
jgi:outer membrane porin, OprD family